MRWHLIAVQVFLGLSACAPDRIADLTQPGRSANCSSSYMPAQFSLDSKLADCNSLIESGDTAPGKLFLLYISRGDILDQLSQPDLALRDYGRAISIMPDYADAYHWRGLSYARNKQFKRAIPDFDRAIALPWYGQPSRRWDSAWPLLERGKAYAGLHRYARAIGDFTAVIRMDTSELSDAYFNRSLARRATGQLGLATADAAKARATVTPRPD